MDGSDEKFRPWTPRLYTFNVCMNIKFTSNILIYHIIFSYNLFLYSLYQLNLGENRGVVNMYHGNDIGEFNQMAHIPVKANNDYYTIGDILANGETLHEEVVSILAMVKKVTKE